MLEIIDMQHNTTDVRKGSNGIDFMCLGTRNTVQLYTAENTQSNLFSSHSWRSS